MGNSEVEDNEYICVCHGDTWITYQALLEHQVSHYSYKLRILQEKQDSLIRIMKCSPTHIRHFIDIDQALERRENRLHREENRLKREAHKIQLLRLQVQRDQQAVNKKKQELRDLERRYGCIALPDE